MSYNNCGPEVHTDIRQVHDQYWRTAARSPLLLVMIVLCAITAFFNIASGDEYDIYSVLFAVSNGLMVIGLLVVYIQGWISKEFRKVSGLAIVRIGLLITLFTTAAWGILGAIGIVFDLDKTSAIFAVAYADGDYHGDYMDFREAVRKMLMLLAGIMAAVGVTAVILYAKLIVVVSEIKTHCESVDCYCEDVVSTAKMTGVLSALSAVVGVYFMMRGNELIRSLEIEMFVFSATMLAITVWLVWYKGMKKELFAYYQAAQKNNSTEKTEEVSLEKLPAWKRVELMKQKEAEEQK